MTTTKRGFTKRMWLMVVVLAEALVAVPMAWAHHDPPGCFGAGVDVDIFIFRKRCSLTLNRACTVDADCPGGETCVFAGLAGTVAPCETVYYDAILSKDATDATTCAFSGGTFKLTLPDGSTGAINNSVPCLGGTTAPCDPLVNEVRFTKVPFTVNVVPPTTILATASYVNGASHDGGGTPNDDGDTPNAASGSQGITRGIITCNDNDVCTNDICNPAFNGSAACQHSPITCNDNDPCTLNQCNPVTGCFFPPGALDCNDNDPCTSDACVPGTGCVNTPGALDCDDNNVCTNDQCTPGVGCTHQDISAQCNDNDPCTDDLCDPIQGCQNPPNNNPTCLELNHFQCYEIKPFQFARVAASVEDRYFDASVSIRSPDHLCAPSDKRGEDPTAPQDPEHLTGFPAVGGPVRVPNQTIQNQFGTVTVDLIRRAFLLVPTSKSLVSPPPPLVNPTTDHFQCYSVRRSSGQPAFNPVRGVSAVDQFGSHAVDLLRPRFFCTPANKNDEDPGAPAHTQNLLCYKTRHREPFTVRTPFINNQFVTTDVKLVRRIEFCVPSTLVLN